MTHMLRTLLIAAALVLLAGPAAARSALEVAYAGSMGTVMDSDLGPAFARRAAVDFHGIGRGSYGLAHLLVAGEMRADVFVGVTAGPAHLLLEKGLAEEAIPVASTQMVIAYSPASRHRAALRAAAAGKRPWYTILERPDVRFGRTDPAVDPQGRNIVFTLQLAERYYHQPGLAERILGSYENPRQIFAEMSLLTRLESGQIDASSGYLSAVESRGLPYIRLPPEINLGDPAYTESWYSKAGFELKSGAGVHRVTPEPLVFYAQVLANSRHPALARAFVAFLRSPEGQAILARNGYSPPHGPALHRSP